LIRAVYLLGFRGSGKTTLGERLARELGWDFYDLDQEWERRQGRSIVGFVEEFGLDLFRQSEHELLRETASMAGPVVIATGGGVVEFAPSRAFLLSEEAPKVFLDVKGTELWRRLESQPERRKIGGLSSPEAMEKLLLQRLPHYAKIATFRVSNQDITSGLIEIKQSLGL
jgi:shikimate kinase